MSQNAWVLCGVLLSFGALASACQPGGIGDPCTPEDEYRVEFSGYSVGEVNVESKSFQCETRLCLVNHFEGRVSCPYGQSEAAGKGDVAKMREERKGDGAPQLDGDKEVEERFCHVPGTSDKTHRITAQVNPQLVARRADQAVYCSCRCGGPDANAKYCSCPSGYTCQELIQPIAFFGASELAGSYCIKAGTGYTSASSSTTCEPKKGSEGSNPPGNCGSWNGQ